MRQKDGVRRLRRALRFPRVWFTSEVMSVELFRQQLSSLRRHFGTRSRPINGSEHWRYGAFRFLLGRIKDEKALIKLLSVAHADPDVPMGSEMVKDIQKHPLAAAEVESAVSRFRSNTATESGQG